ncbi:MAG TPA: helix-turn-helix domain-containing protein [Desertimonas sp.]|nr:helix-turn-helix domain-containing protein [Desertimonas sp.]
MTIDNTSLAGAVRQVGDRWSLRLIAALLDGDRTFSELSEEVDGIAPNILTARLKALQRDALVAARPYQRRPVRMSYSLTASGRRLGDAVALLAQWGAARQGRNAGSRHETCGSTLELRPWCPTCEIAVEPAQPSELIWV